MMIDTKRKIAALLLTSSLVACGGDGSPQPAPATGGTPPAPASNSAPTISGSPSASARAGDAYSFTPTASDADGDTLTFSAENLPAWATLDTATGAVTGTVVEGTFPGIVITVSDGTDSTSLPPFAVDVSSADPKTSLPAELQGVAMTLLFEDDFDDQVDFTTEAKRDYCSGESSGNNCDILPRGWTDYISWESWHPADLADAQAGLQINDTASRTPGGKAAIIWDESRGRPSQWGSDAMIGKRFEGGHEAIYAEMWLRHQPGYEWTFMDPLVGKGLNYMKLLRITHNDPDVYAFKYGSDGNADLIALAVPTLWAFDENGERVNRGRVGTSVTCAPRATNYKCGTYSHGIQSDLKDPRSYEERFQSGPWHKIAMRVDINSAPGVADGRMSVWIDDELHMSADDIPYLGESADASTLFNMVTFGGNMHNYPRAEAERFEQWHAIDDVRIFSINK